MVETDAVASATQPSKKIYVGNIGFNVSVDAIENLFGFSTSPLKNLCTVQMLTNADGKNCQNYATISVPEHMFNDIITLNGTEFQGQHLEIRPALDLDDMTEFGAAQSEGPHVVPPSPPEQQSIGGSAECANYASVTGSDNSVNKEEINTRRYIELDTTFYNNPYSIPNVATMVHAVSRAFSFDESKKLIKLTGRDNGLYTIETKNPQLYEKIEILEYSGQNMARVSVKTERQVVDKTGKVTFKRNSGNFGNNRDDELLITLYRANTDDFEDVTDNIIYEEIVKMNIGKLKKGLTLQTYRRTDVPNGNKYFVLQNLSEGDKEKLPQSFDFLTKSGSRRMWLNWTGKKRKCQFCSNFHDGQCEIEEKIRQLEKERDAIKKECGGSLPTKTYSDSTLRHAAQNSLASDVDAMPGGAIGNILNAIKIDESNKDIKNIIIVAGQNEMNRAVETEEYIWMLKKTHERVVTLADNRTVAIIPPPHQKFLEPESIVKEEMFKETLDKINQHQNVTVWENPIAEYEEDGGRHPTQQQTQLLLQHINEKVGQTFDLPYFLNSATPDTMTTKKYYGRVTALYKYGCAGCENAENKVYNLCTTCKEALKNDPEVKEIMTEFVERVKQVQDKSSPQLSTMNQPCTNPVNPINPVPSENVSNNGVRERSPLKANNGDDVQTYGK